MEHRRNALNAPPAAGHPRRATLSCAGWMRHWTGTDVTL